MHRLKGRFSWELCFCGLHGHATYAPSEEHLASQLQVVTVFGPAWR